MEIKIDAWEKNDLLRILDYAQEKKIEDCNKDKITVAMMQKDIKKIQTLRQRAMGKDYKPMYELQRPGYSDESIRERAKEVNDLPKAPFTRGD